MPRQKPSDKSAQEILSEPQKRSLLVTGYLQQFALPGVFNRELTEQDFEMWQKLLANYPLPAIEWAFENWTRNGGVFPKPKNILELIGAWSITNKADDFQACAVCGDGWLSEENINGNRVVRRCQCFIDWAKRKKEQVA